MKQIESINGVFLFGELEETKELEPGMEITVTLMEPRMRYDEIGKRTKEWQRETHRFYVPSRNLRLLAEQFRDYADQAEERLNQHLKKREENDDG